MIFELIKNNSKNLPSWRQGNSAVFTQIRSSTKKAAGSRTSMKDSAGRRLGPKKYEGQNVKIGEIIMRQRGTKFYPGENVGIGKDHTIYAKEPGVVRYYLDPFHPKRKFIGVSLSRDIRLPTPHFEPTVRRFGHLLVSKKKNPKLYKEVSEFLPRKTELAKDDILKGLQQREENRTNLRNIFKTFLQEEIKLDSIKNDEDLELCLDYLIRLRLCLKNGIPLSESQFNASYYLETLQKLQNRRLKQSSEELTQQQEKLNQLTKLINQSISFDNNFNIVKFLSQSDKNQLRSKLIENLKALKSESKYKEIQQIFDKSKSTEGEVPVSSYLTKSEEVSLRNKYLYAVTNEIVNPTLEQLKELQKKNSSNKKNKKVKNKTGDILIKRYNYETHHVENVIRQRPSL
ncbi:hypothetical protein TBLA_0D04830 [Henningerozyma blattae CBS 6284]|uniref:Large ribosomal subunit protein bL27m n=1 Tax=Henningerozyma blattae (strain ATCC 34711 / CBS 6284 / DSM 70876 / NBRC 10599 / NRRL Y-10934 / UCD 77-7) TaxID=1071380 RepID=I2H3M7_HENB6|nr:hypothetical protein TBLA_0D04830 [Tetrapisispora blattae CBS 6284]CCH60979.1 hypothetical protein TBLA_0D04830 [Tetrapisispora blattae CBS 6284]